MQYATARDAYYGEILSREFYRARNCEFCSLDIIFGTDEDITIKVKPMDHLNDPPKGAIYYTQATSDDDAFCFHNIDNESDIVTFPFPDDYLLEYNDLEDGCVTAEQCAMLIRCNHSPGYPSDYVRKYYAERRDRFDKSKSRAIPYADLLQHIYAHQKRLLKEGKIWGPLPCGTQTTYGYFSHPNELPTLAEATDGFIEFMMQHGLFDDCVEEIFYIDPERTKPVSAIAEKIMKEYDEEPVEVSPPGSPQTNWEKFGLGSDDDVDYNGGYVTHAIDLLLDFISTRSAYESKGT